MTFMDIRKEVLEILKKDSLIANDVIAKMLEIDEAEAAAARKALEEEGIIMRYSVLVNTEKQQDGPAEALIELKVAPQRDFGYDDIARRVYNFPEVKSVYLVSGRYDLAVLVEAKTMKAISQFVWEKLAVLEGIASTETIFIMRKYKEHGEIMVGSSKVDRLVVTP